MRIHLAHATVIAAGCIAAVTFSPAAWADDCGFSGTTDMRELTHRLSQRAVELVRHARRANWQSDGLLRQAIRPDAEFSLGTGDVGQPLASGVAGAHALAAAMNADRYRYLEYRSIPMPAEPCAEHKVKVEFIDTGRGEVVPVEFTFVEGVLVSAKGWTMWFTDGKLSD